MVGTREKLSTTCDAQCVRAGAKGPPSVTSVNLSRRPGAGVAVALAAAASMSVRRPRTRLKPFANGDRETERGRHY
jgi:hypothetical protein